MTITTATNPTAYITVGKNRQKIYSGNRIFLDNGTEFEIELFNPTDKVILAKIILNGTNTSNTGLVLNPGVRVFLDRHMNDQKHLKFDTYEVEKNNEYVEKAIANNGRILIEFYEEETHNQFYTGQYYDNIFQQGGTNYSNAVYGNGNITLDNLSNDFTANINTSTTASNRDLYSGKLTTSNATFDKVFETKETGRVEQGSTSDQVFTNVNKRFKIFSFYSVQYQMLPKSEKPVEVQDIRVYCTSCGTRRRNDNWKFCPKCGAKYE
jgi:ribosomal protein L44E